MGYSTLLLASAATSITQAAAESSFNNLMGLNESVGETVPRVAFKSTDEINTLISGMLPSSINEKLSEGADYSSVLTGDEIDIVNSKIYSTGYPEYAQTSKYHLFGFGSTDVWISAHFLDYDKYNWINADISEPNKNKSAAHATLAHRFVWSAGGSSPDGPGGSGESYMQADFRSSPFQLPDIDIQRFRLEPVLRAGFLPAMRPGKFGGIKEHPSRYNTMRVMSIDGGNIFASTNFMLTGLREESSENFSVDPSMWGLSIRFDIEKYSIYTLSIKLINSQNFDWVRQFKYAWNNYLRGSVLAGNQWRFYMLSGARLLGGYPVKYQMLSDAKDAPTTQMSMVMIVTDDESLPVMQEIVSKESGLTYFRWEGSVYSSPMAGTKTHVIEPSEESQDLIASSEDETVFPPEMTVL